VLTAAPVGALAALAVIGFALAWPSWRRRLRPSQPRRRGARAGIPAAALTAAVVVGLVARGLASVSGAVDLADGYHVRIDGAAAGDYAGGVVSDAGDVNGDGKPDIVVTARLADPQGRSDAGAAYVLFGPLGSDSIDLASLSPSDGFRIDGAAAGDEAGSAAANVGDVNGDGTGDLLVTAAGADNRGRSSSGSAYVIFGGSTGDLDLASLGSRGVRIDGAGAGDKLGAVAGFDGEPISPPAVADVNGDGLADVVLGARFAAVSGRAQAGAATSSSDRRRWARSTSRASARPAFGSAAQRPETRPASASPACAT
jgi:hypothetical protein